MKRTVFALAVLMGGCFEDAGDVAGSTSGAGSTEDTSADSAQTTASGSGSTSGSGSATSSASTMSTSASNDSGDTAQTSTETTDPTTATSTTSDTMEDTGSPLVSCPDTFPMFDKSCNSNADCVVALHQTDCCGNEVAWGINGNDAAAFDEAEAICRSQYPMCRCPVGPIMTDNGDSTFDINLIQVACVNGGVCETSVL
jgi:hypothetical protein